jgi:hypothetical protein
MSTATQTDAKPAEPVYKPRQRLTSAAFVQSAPFGDERMSCQVGLNCDSIIPARLEPDGSCVPISSGQRADGILVRRKKHDLQTQKRFVDQCFIPWSNVRGLSYGE